MTDFLQEYRREAEKQYSEVIVRFLNLGKQSLQAEEIYSGLTSTQEAALSTLKDALRRKLEKLEDVELRADSIKREVCHILLYYLQMVYFVRDQKTSLVGQAILENEQQRWKLDSATAQRINAAVLRKQVDKPKTNQQKTSESQKWGQYAELLFKAIQQDGIPLKINTQTQLKLLQLQLGIPDSEVPPVEKLQSKRGVNYIPLWQSLKRGDWHAANEETRRCLVKASGLQQDLQMVDVHRIDIADLQTIDTLWSDASSGRFGFKIQREIWEKIDPRLEDLEALGRKLDWRRSNSWISYESMDFSKNAVPGHLPTFPYIGWWCWVGNLKAILDQFSVEDARTVA